eukprot:PhM_4_TR8999/c0_g1_i1/m.3515
MFTHTRVSPLLLVLLAMLGAAVVPQTHASIDIGIVIPIGKTACLMTIGGADGVPAKYGYTMSHFVDGVRLSDSAIPLDLVVTSVENHGFMPYSASLINPRGSFSFVPMGPTRPHNAPPSNYVVCLTAKSPWWFATHPNHEVRVTVTPYEDPLMDLNSRKMLREKSGEFIGPQRSELDLLHGHSHNAARLSKEIRSHMKEYVERHNRRRATAESNFERATWMSVFTCCVAGGLAGFQYYILKRIMLRRKLV